MRRNRYDNPPQSSSWRVFFSVIRPGAHADRAGHGGETPSTSSSVEIQCDAFRPQRRCAKIHRAMAEEQHFGGLRRILSRELRYPVLFIRRDQLLQICQNAESLPYPEGLFVDNQGFAYQVVAVSDSPLLRATRAERRRLSEEGLENIPNYVYYKGEPVQLSVEDIRQRIGWLAGARGHFEMPEGMGMPDLSRAESIHELMDVLLTTGFR